MQSNSQTSKWCSYFKHILTGKKRRKSDEEKTKAIKTTHIGSPLYFQGHTMMYLGTYNGRIYVISALGSLYDAGNDEKRNVYSVAINTLDAKRANGKTWLANITGYNQFEFTDE